MSIETSVLAEVDPFKPYLRAIEAMVIAFVVAGICFGIWHYGHSRYEEGRADDHKGWDAEKAQWTQALNQQKADAATMLAQAYADRDSEHAKAVTAAAQQEKDYETYMAGTAALKSQLAARSLRFDAGTPAAPGRGKGGGPAVPASGAQALPAPSTIVQLPDRIQQPLVALMGQAEDLRNAYRKCVAAVNGGPAL